MIPQAWFCPSCQKHHAPHVETCPGPANALPLPGVTIPLQPLRYVPQPWDAPWVPSYPNTAGDIPNRLGGGAYQPQPLGIGTVIWNGQATTGAIQ